MILIYFLYTAVFSSAAFSLNAKNIIAYPVPFNPDIHHTLRIGYEFGITPDEINRVKIEICDINGDNVFSRTYPSLESIKWNGRNDKGRLVKTGLYIIKIIIENTDGGYGKKIIRILINR